MKNILLNACKIAQPDVKNAQSTTKELEKNAAPENIWNANVMSVKVMITPKTIFQLVISKENLANLAMVGNTKLSQIPVPDF